MRTGSKKVLISAVATAVASILSQALCAQAAAEIPRVAGLNGADSGSDATSVLRVDFDLPEQNLSDSLRAVGRQTDINILINQDLIGGRQAPALRAQLTVSEALERLLRGTGLVPRFVDDDTVVLAGTSSGAGYESVKTTARMPAQSMTGNIRLARSDDGDRDSRGRSVLSGFMRSFRMAAADEGADAASDATPPMEEVLIEAQRRASTATKFDLNVIETPQSIKAITKDVLDFASVRNFSDLSKIDASTNTNGTVQGRQHLSFRGLDANSDQGIKVDGLQALAKFPLDMAVFDRVEILKGPSSTIYGQNSAGGMVNAVTKRPKAQSENNIQAQVGSFDYYRFEADSTGPVTQDGKLTYRLFGTYSDGGEFADFVESNSRVAFGSLNYEVSDTTSVRTYVHYQEREFTQNKGLAVVSDGATPVPHLTIPDVPASRFVGPEWALAQGNYFSAYGEVTHKVADNWLLKAGATYDRTARDGTGIGFFDLFDTNGDIDQTYLYFSDNTSELWGGEVSLTGDFQMFGRSNTIFVGVDSRRVESDNLSASTPGGVVFNIYDPDYAAFGPARHGLADYAGAFANQGQGTNRYWGGSLQVLLHPLERVSVLAGARYDSSKQETDRTSGTFAGGSFVPGGLPRTTLLDTNRFVPQVGVTYEVKPEVNLYFNYGKSFVPQTGITFGGDLIDPEQGHQYEAGIKGNFLDRRLTATLAAFELVRNHISAVDPEHPQFSRDLGEQQSRGVELELFGEMRKGWTVFGTAAYLDAKIKAGNPLDVGARLLNVPRFAYSVYSNYKIPAGPLQGLGFGGGIVSKQDRVWGLPSFAWIRQQMKAGGYTTADLRMFYERDRSLFELKVNNVTNEKYYNQYFPGLKGGLFPGRPREVIARVTYRF